MLLIDESMFFTVTILCDLDIIFFCRAVIRELVETEEEFGKDLQTVVERYIKTIDSNKKVPRLLRDNKDLIFMNFQQISDFHNT